jgi:hypothetical protein
MTKTKTRVLFIGNARINILHTDRRLYLSNSQNPYKLLALNIISAFNLSKGNCNINFFPYTEPVIDTNLNNFYLKPAVLPNDE